MNAYRITNTTSGLTLGDYTGATAEDAGVAMLRDAGYPGATAEDIDDDLEIVEVTRWTHMVDEARAMGLTVRGDCIYLIDGGRDADSVYLTEYGMGEIGLCEYDCQRCPVSERETVAGLLAAVRSEVNL